MEFRKALAKYYRIWYKNSLESVEYCERNGDFTDAEQYRDSAKKYLKIITENNEAIDFFSQDDNAFLNASSLPEKFRNYK